MDKELVYIYHHSYPTSEDFNVGQRRRNDSKSGGAQVPKAHTFHRIRT
jgi:hypothetical protein